MRTFLGAQLAKSALRKSFGSGEASTLARDGTRGVGRVQKSPELLKCHGTFKRRW